MKSSRGDKGIKAEVIVRMLGKAGWEERQGSGDHIVLSKQGHQQIVLAKTISMAQWKNVEHSIGLQLETLLSKAVRGRGNTLPAEELRKRVVLAAEMARAGFPLTFIRKHSGTGSLPGFSIGMLEERGVDGVVSFYSQPRPQQTVLSIRHVEESEVPPAPIEHDGYIRHTEHTAECIITGKCHAGCPAWVEPEVTVVPEVQHAPTEQRDGTEVDAILTLMQELVTDVRGLLAEKQAKRRVFLSAYRRAMALRQTMVRELDSLIDEMAKSWVEEGEE